MFKNILVPVDGSATANKGLREAIRLAREQGATLTLVHVVEEGLTYRSMGLDGAGFFLDEVLRALVRSGRVIVARALSAAHRAGVKARGEVIEDISEPVADVIVREARKAKADLIVLGTHGRRGITRLVMGSDAEGVVRKSTVPVVLVRAPVRAQAAKGAKPPAKGRAPAIARA
ncbi:MAG TPA: universal stress protein [Burkholderiales bacterium]|nr:universal stress protein [Burkholderiales bacterium]